MCELVVVEDRGALADAFEGEALDQLLAAHYLGVVVVAPAEQREEVDEGLGDVTVGAEVLDSDCAVALRELAPVGPVQQWHVRVDRQLRAQRLQDLELLRRVRDVVLSADHVRDPVEHVLER